MTRSVFLTQAGAFLARPIAFVLVGVYVALWLFFDHKTFEWHSILTVLTLIHDAVYSAVRASGYAGYASEA